MLWIGEKYQLFVLFILGSLLLNTEVWTWGSSEYGQLGVGDQIRRNSPTLVPKLCNVGVQKLACGNYHCAALTLDGSIFVWGRNNYHQILTDTTDNQYSPRVWKLNSRFKAIACGDSHSAFLNNTSLILIGKHFTEDKFEFENFNKIFSSGILTCLSGGSKHSDKNTDLEIEQQCLESLITIYVEIIKQFRDKSEIYERLCSCFEDMLYFTAANVFNLIEGGSIEIIDNHLYIYKNYLKALCDVIAVGGFKHISSFVEIPPPIYIKFSSVVSKKDKKDSVLSVLFEEPLQQVKTGESVFFETVNKQLKEAYQTREFWESTGKVIESLRSPERRLLKESRTTPIFLGKI